MRRALFTCVLLASIPGLAAAGPKLTAGTERDPKLFLDEPESLFEVRNSDGGFTVRASGRLSGYTSTSDQLHLEVELRGKPVEKVLCEVSAYSTQNHWAEVVCTGKKPLKGAGPVTGRLTYWDDTAERAYLVRTFAATAHEASFEGVPSWVGTFDDLLGAAYARHMAADPGRLMPPEVMLHFWTSGEARNQRLRCTVDGKKLPDFDLSPRTGAIVNDELELDQQSRGVRQTVKWRRHRTVVSNLIPGDKEALSKDFDPTAYTQWLWLADHPGQWVCDVRANGAAGRRFAFTVADGKIARHPSQDREGALPSWRNVSQLAVTFPAEAPFDERIRPEALTKSLNFGLPWPAGSEDLRAGLPTKKKGTFEPKRAKH